MAGGLEFKMDLSEVEKMLKAFVKTYPVEMQRTKNKLLNDMAFAFKEIAPEVIAQLKTVRNEAFVKKQIQVEKAAGNKPEARAGSVAIEQSSSQGAFSGWSEDYGEKPKGRRVFRSIGKNARGGSMQSKAKPKAWLKKGYSIIHTDDIQGTSYGPNRLMAAIAYTAKTAGVGGQLIVSRDMVNKDGGKGLPAELWIIRSMKGYKGRPKLKLMQRWSGEEITHERDDWVGETLARMKTWYPPEDMFERYMAPIFRKMGAK
jgi:hypothetical protein